MLHILSRKKPYDGSPISILLTVLKGERPQIPTDDENITQQHKSVIKMCWDREESKRPSAEALLRILETFESSLYVQP
ncbi:hypothetical protein J3R82DRAFT_10457 [Butyriboletus roseoflavus]|nr:hypothetical protein J3R82DRAFT_10457 [Butyriboletus roseoflavus]